MVTCKLYGRLGNQCFQIAATIATALKNNTIYKIPQISINTSVWPTYFKQFPPLIDNDVITTVYKEPSHAFAEIPFTKGMCLDGYFQSEKYFEDYRDYIIKIFSEGFEYNQRKGTVSIHVRRGDFLTLQTKHPPVTIEYIANAIEYLKNRNYYGFIVYSDDMQWCKENINSSKFTNCHFEYNNTFDPKYDMLSMSECEHNIIANSSFSWWGAWLNRNTKKIVVAPSNWFGKDNSHLDTRDLLPKEWLII